LAATASFVAADPGGVRSADDRSLDGVGTKAASGLVLENSTAPYIPVEYSNNTAGDQFSHLYKAIVDNENVISEAIVDAQNNIDSAIVDSTNSVADQHNQLSQWLYDTLCLIYEAVDGSCGAEMVPFQASIPMIKVDALSNSVQDKADNVEGEMGIVKGKLDAMQGKVDALSSSMQGKVDNVEGKVDAVQDELKEVKVMISKLMGMMAKE